MPIGLQVGPFPGFVSLQKKEMFLQHFGSIQTIPIRRRNKESYIIGVFKSEHACEDALHRIHQIKVFGRRLTAKYCDLSHESKRIHPHERKPCHTNSSYDGSFKTKKVLKEYESKLAAISSSFDINYPVSPKLRYLYPPPSAKVITNIAHALVSVPKFYTQVLHLMNKMNLPCPFGALTSQPPIIEETKTLSNILITKDLTKEAEEHNEAPFNKMMESASESESELESEEDTSIINRDQQKIPLKRKRKWNIHSIKRPKLDQLKQTMLKVPKDNRNLKSAAIEEIFDSRTDVLSHKKLEVRLDNTNLLEIASGSHQLSTPEGGFGKIYPVLNKDNESEEAADMKETPKYISFKELQDNSVCQSDWPIIPAFKNFSKGEPSTKLYIKNLAKNVTEADLKFIFGRYVKWSIAEDESKFSIRHMREGRMKGQAFVTFSSLEVAAKAMEEVNGYILKDKPMVIVFGRNKPAEPS